MKNMPSWGGLGGGSSGGGAGGEEWRVLKGGDAEVWYLWGEDGGGLHRGVGALWGGDGGGLQKGGRSFVGRRSGREER